MIFGKEARMWELNEPSGFSAVPPLENWTPANTVVKTFCNAKLKKVF